MTRSGRTVWITRTAPGAGRLANRVREAGFDPVVSPLLGLDPDFRPPGIVPGDVAALAFTSVNGLAFADLTPRRDWPVFAVGDRTAEAARRRGFTEAVSAGGDASALAERIAAAWGDRKGVLLAPGAEQPAADLAGLLAGRVPTRPVAVYRMIEAATALPEAFDIVMLQSARAAEALARRLTPGLAATCIAIAQSPAVAGPIRALGFAEVRIAAHPNENSLLEALGKAPRPV
ncbi:MAG: uroporphyrinogen-III synthase [Pseudolabrys sp.]|nr:uroporphyrinogen-III synthase [Pseudolabrys sp.]